MYESAHRLTRDSDVARPVASYDALAYARHRHTSDYRAQLMLSSLTRPENRSRLITLCLALLCVVLGAGTLLGLKYYGPWRLHRLTTEAREAADRGDFAVASLNARRALQTAPDDRDVCLLMAEVLEKGSNPDAVAWRAKVAELTPGSTDALLEWARVAVKFRRLAAADRALGSISGPGRQRIDYLALAGQVALDSGRLAEAERIFTELVQREPDNAAHHLALGRVEVLSGDLFTREAGRRELHELASTPAHAPIALRALVASYAASGETAAGLRESERLLRLPEHTFLDRLTHLQLLHAAKDERFPGELAALEDAAAQTPRHAGALIVWMNSAGMAREAVEWATERAPTVGRMPDVRQAIAGCYLTLGDWSAVLKLTADPWRQAEYVRHAYRSKAMRERGDLQLARTEWNQATSAAQGMPDAIKWLSSVASKADWSDEAEQALWMAVGNVPDAKWAVDQLGRRFHEQKDTAGLLRLALKFLANEPQHENIRNDVAFLTVLLGKDTERALIMAHELSRKHPENAAYASTYALALLAAKRPAEALEVLQKLPPEELAKPPIAAHYGVVLVENGRMEEAPRFLDLGRLAPLLPEEVALLDKAAAKLGPPASATP